MEKDMCLRLRAYSQETHAVGAKMKTCLSCLPDLAALRRDTPATLDGII